MGVGFSLRFRALSSLMLAGFKGFGLRKFGKHNPKGSMYPNSIYFGPKVPL